MDMGVDLLIDLCVVMNWSRGKDFCFMDFLVTLEKSVLNVV
ncbi:hypothetical protein Xsto_01650 [Xenorhabdus stockiae]|uniref:Uncharacterized protein n=1 Tax=Xenorhabdus stockiae TaxID=351614 RepID=A0A2D0KR54_9GAMM|nr:hypothetical protein Xsto_01650 [Xenorhabdus stockiae]PHM68509.1 hypothetical protein Xekj_03336 [Xenorhabdus sp. KJ12.1]